MKSLHIGLNAVDPASYETPFELNACEAEAQDMRRHRRFAASCSEEPAHGSDEDSGADDGGDARDDLHWSTLPCIEPSPPPRCSGGGLRLHMAQLVELA